MFKHKTIHRLLLSVYVQILSVSFVFAGDASSIWAVELPGKYSCSFTIVDGRDTYDYPNFDCMIRNKDNKLELEKLTGSQRIRGVITLGENEFSFEGMFFCPQGDCDSKVSGNFERLSSGSFRGVINKPDDQPDAKIIVNLKKRKGR